MLKKVTLFFSIPSIFNFFSNFELQRVLLIIITKFIVSTIILSKKYFPQLEVPGQQTSIDSCSPWHNYQIEDRELEATSCHWPTAQEHLKELSL